MNSIDNNDIRVTSSNGLNQLATRVSVDNSSNGVFSQCTLIVLSREEAVFGTAQIMVAYNIFLEGNQITNVNGTLLTLHH
jgi:hypothetical protein